MQSVDLIPLAYWWRTRVTSAGLLVDYLSMYFGYGLVVAAALGTLTVESLSIFLISWVGYMSLYELGYLMNDSWSQGREKRRGEFVRKVPLKLVANFVVPLVLIRVATFALVLWGLSALLPAIDLVAFVAIIVAMSVAFVCHNIVFFPTRIGTFFLLYLSRYSLGLLAFVPFQELTVWSAILFGIPALAYAIAYGLAKNSYYIFASNASFRYRIAGALLLVAFVSEYVFAGEVSRTPLMLAALLIVTDLAFGLSRFMAAAVAACAEQNAYHVHTDLSHDCEMPMRATVTHPAVQGRVVFLSDHAETFNAAKYAELCTSAKQANQEQSDVVVESGLEFPICGQHILAFGLRQFVDVQADKPQGVDVLKRVSSLVIWAHPHFKIRRCVSPRYLQSLYYLLKSVDGYEFVNLKSTRGWHFWWRHLFVSVLGTVLFGSKKLIIGLDAHEPRHFERYAKLMALAPARRMYCCLVSGGLA